MLEIRRVVDPRGQNHDRGVGLVGGRRVAQRAQQVRSVVIDRPHPMGGEQVRKDPRHGAPVLHHIRHPRRRAQVVLENPKVAAVVADQVDAGDVDSHTVGWHDPDCLTVKVLTGGHQPARDDTVAQNLLITIDVVEVALEGLDPLGDATFQSGPLGAEMTRGTRSSGNGRSWPDSENVMPWSMNARPSASARALSSDASDGASSA